MTREEQGFVESAKKGDAEAFGKLYDKYLPAIYRYVFLKISHKQEAEDITHHVFLNAWQNMRSYKFQGFPFSSWLYRIAHNAVVDHYRTQKSHISMESLEIVSEEPQAENVLLDTKLDQAFDLQLVKTALSKLGHEEQNVLIMKFVNELSNKEISTTLGKSEGAVRVVQHRALKKLKELVGRKTSLI